MPVGSAHVVICLSWPAADRSECLLRTSQDVACFLNRTLEFVFALYRSLSPRGAHRDFVKPFVVSSVVFSMWI